MQLFRQGSLRIILPNEKLMYHLIARRFIAAFYPDCIFSSTTVLASVGDFGFKATGKTILSPGWREIYLKDKKEEKDKESDSILPVFTVGESGPHKPELLKKRLSHRNSILRVRSCVRWKRQAKP